MVRTRGRMNTTSHSTVLSALNHQAQRFHHRLDVLPENRHYSWAIDETGTLETSRLLRISDIEIEQQEISEINCIQIPKEMLQDHGYAPPMKTEGVVRLIYENVNGFCNCLSGNTKIERAKEINDELEIDIAAYCEHKLNMSHKKNVNSFNRLFKGREAAIHSILKHNVHENVGQVQQGGTSLHLIGHLMEQIDHNKSGKDDSGLGCWSVMKLQGDGVRTRVVCRYNPCGNSKLNSGTMYKQHKRYLVMHQKDLACPRKKFHDDLISQLKKWRNEGDHLVVCLAANEDIYQT